MYHWCKSNRGYDIVFTYSGTVVARVNTQQDAEKRCAELNELNRKLVK